MGFDVGGVNMTETHDEVAKDRTDVEEARVTGDATEESLGV
jgi:hypothetical protein